MKQPAKKAFQSNKSDFQRMKKITKSYISKREFLAQETVYLILVELWLRKVCPKIIFSSNNLPENQYSISRSEDGTSKLPEESTNVFQRNMLNRYICRPYKYF